MTNFILSAFCLPTPTFRNGGSNNFLLKQHLPPENEPSRNVRAMTQSELILE